MSVKIFFGVLLMFVTQAVFAALPVTLSGPVPAISASYVQDSTQTVVYTLTNNVTHALPLSVTGLSSPLSRTTVAHDCGTTLPAGPATCNIGVTIAPTSADAGNTVNQTLTIDYNGRTPFTQKISFSVPEPVLPVTLMAVGEIFKQNPATYFPPLVVVSTDSGATWTDHTMTPGFPAQGAYNGGTCHGTGSSVLCIAAGVNYNTSTIAAIRYILGVSQNGGNNWTSVTVPDLAADPETVLWDVSCTDKDSSTLCVAVGYIEGSTIIDANLAVILVSTDKGVTWALTDFTYLSRATGLESVSCTGSGASTVCVAAGYFRASDAHGFAPLTAISTDRGVTWNKNQLIVGYIGKLKSVSCTGSGSTAICATISLAGDIRSSAIFVSTNGATDWAMVSQTSKPFNITSPRISCTGTGTSAVCAANIGDSLVVSTDGGVTWVEKSVTGYTGSPRLFSVSCVGNGASAVCAAVGQDNNTSLPIVVASTDGGVTWYPRAITNMASGTHGELDSVHCTKTGASVVCVAAGADYTTNYVPLLVYSNDGSVATWSIPTNITFPNDGNFVGTGGATSNIALKRKKWGLSDTLQDYIKKGTS